MIGCIICDRPVEHPEVFTICLRCKERFGIEWGMNDIPRFRKELEEDESL